MEQELLLDVPQVAERLNVSERSVRRWAYEKRLSSVKLGKLLRFKQKDVEQFVEDHHQTCQGNQKQVA